MTIERKVNRLIVVVLIALLAWLFWRVQLIHLYLGSAEGPDATEWTGLRGYLKESTTDLRKRLTDMDCRIWMLGVYPTDQHPYSTKPRPSPCPPGPPSLVPKDSP
jgi:hypothetical protein